MAVELFVVDPDRGDLYVANGVDAVMRWDGFASGFENAGIIAPTVKVTVAGSGTGAIVGTYWAYVRFLDDLGNFSNLSPISTEFDASGATKAITGVSSETPMK